MNGYEVKFTVNTEEADVAGLSDEVYSIIISGIGKLQGVVSVTINEYTVGSPPE